MIFAGWRPVGIARAAMVLADLAPILGHDGCAAIARLITLEDFGVPVSG
jgi:hypothetical protein